MLSIFLILFLTSCSAIEEEKERIQEEISTNDKEFCNIPKTVPKYFQRHSTCCLLALFLPLSS